MYKCWNHTCMLAHAEAIVRMLAAAGHNHCTLCPDTWRAILACKFNSRSPEQSAGLQPMLYSVESVQKCGLVMQPVTS